MKNEVRENISVEQDKFSILLRTEQTTVQNEVFPSIEKARGSKRFKKWSETVDAVGMPLIGSVVFGEGVALTLSGLGSRNYLDAIAGAQIAIFGGGFFIRQTVFSIDAAKLAKRQLDKLKSFRS